MTPQGLVRHRHWSVIAAAALCPLICTSDTAKAAHVVRNVLIVTLDTTRADVLAAYGGTNVETPALDRLAREGIVFEQATSAVPLTLPAHCSLFTGLLPPHHGVRDNVDAPLDDRKVTLAEILHARGSRTAAFVASAVVSARRGLTQGFDAYSDGLRTQPNARSRRSAKAVVDEAIEWIAQRDGAPFFAWVHLYDAHAPYSLPEPFRTMYADVPYLGAIAVMDAQIARLLDALEQKHLTHQTLVVVAADHGESLGDHGEDGHGILLYQSTLRVPLIMRIPGVEPRRVPDLVRLVDVMPTVLDAVGVAVSRLDGLSLLPLMKRDVAHVELEGYSESMYPRRFGWSELQALRDGRFKYVNAPRPELYDLEHDPGELGNLYDERRPLAAAMAARLATLAQSSTMAEKRLEELDRDSVERLSSLGYVTPAPPTRPPALTRLLPDPKDCVSVYNAIVRKHSAPARTADVIAVSSPQRSSFEPLSSCAAQPFVSSLLDAALTDAPQPARPTTRTPRAASR